MGCSLVYGIGDAQTPFPRTDPMARILHVSSSPRGDRSSSRKRAQEFLTAWKSKHPGDTVTDRDVGHAPPAHVTEPWVAAAYLQAIFGFLGVTDSTVVLWENANAPEPAKQEGLAAAKSAAHVAAA